MIEDVTLPNMEDDHEQYQAIVDDLLSLADKIEAVIELEEESYRRVYAKGYTE